MRFIRPNIRELSARNLSTFHLLAAADLVVDSDQLAAVNTLMAEDAAERESESARFYFVRNPQSS
jgi:hypothetical protein